MFVEASRGYLSGLFNNHCRRQGIRVFAYHGVVEHKKDPLLERNLHLIETFKEHVRLLKRFRIVSLTEIVSDLSTIEKTKAAAAITFDDGYSNNLIACDVLRNLRWPWTVFVSTGTIGRNTLLWTTELALLLLHGNRRQVELMGQTWPLVTRAEREVAFQTIRRKLKLMPSETRKQTMDVLRSQFPDGEVESLSQKFPSLQMLSWNEVEELSRNGAEIGSHGVDHEIHHVNQPEDVRLYELNKSKAQLEARLKRPCRFFAFPNGDFTSTSASEVKSADYSLAFTTQQSTVVSGSDPFSLPRLNPFSSPRMFTRNLYWEPSQDQ